VAAWRLWLRPAAPTRWGIGNPRWREPANAQARTCSCTGWACCQMPRTFWRPAKGWAAGCVESAVRPLAVRHKECQAMFWRQPPQNLAPCRTVWLQGCRRTFHAGILDGHRHTRATPPGWGCGFSWIFLKRGNGRFTGHGPVQELASHRRLQQAACCRTFCKCGVLRTKTQEAFAIGCLSKLAFRAVVPPEKQRFPVCAVQAQTGNLNGGGEQPSPASSPE